MRLVYQGGKEEHSRQVGCIRDVSASAWDVLIRLGAEDTESQVAVTTIKQFSDLMLPSQRQAAPISHYSTRVDGCDVAVEHLYTNYHPLPSGFVSELFKNLHWVVFVCGNELFRRQGLNDVVFLISGYELCIFFWKRITRSSKSEFIFFSANHFSEVSKIPMAARRNPFRN
jgi:hypothetical protein